jgi:hypothetical protein
VAIIGAIAAFLVTRLAVLDADVPLWALTQYSPIDEFAYAIPAFNLNLYGTWVHQAAPWAPIEGLPMNAAQNLVASMSIRLIGDDFWGLRASSVAFGLIVFVALVAVVRQAADDARRHDGISSSLGPAVTVAAAVLLLVDFSSILSGRIVEPTVTRLAAAAVILFLVAHGTFLGARHGIVRSAVFGGVVAAAVFFVYIYNLFLVPPAAIALAWWAYRNGGWAALIRHGVAFAVGGLLVAAAYFGLVAAVYDLTPIDWYRTWIGSFETTTRTGGSVDKVLSILEANVFRLNPAFLGLFIASLPVFAWSVVRRPTAAGILVGAGLVAFVAQAAVVADYPARKFLMMMLFAVPIVASAVLGFRQFRAWLAECREYRIGAVAWLIFAVLVTVLESRLFPIPTGTARLATIVAAAGLAGAVAILVLAIVDRRIVNLAGAVVLGAAVLAPLLYADWIFVYRRPTFTYRDAQIEVRGVVDDQVIAGSLSFGMQLYNTSRPVLSGYHIGQTRSEYERDVVRIFSGGLATSMFSYVDVETRTGWEALGFRVADSYDILLPRGQVLGRYVFEPTAP